MRNKRGESRVSTDDQPESAPAARGLPLRPVTYAILVALLEEPRHGYAVMKLVNQGLGPRALLGPGTLYRTLKELRDDGWIESAEAPDNDSGDERRRYYTLTAAGRQVARAETDRLEILVRSVRRNGVTAERQAET